MGIRLSIIVPVYNVERYVTKCLDSLLNQDLSTSEYEVLLIDDGSTDGSGLIADRYMAHYQNIRVIHQANKGLSAARNVGIVNSIGEYIQFVDSDDYLEPNVLGTLLKRMDSDSLDVLRFDYRNINEEGEAFQPYRTSRAFVDYSETVCGGLSFLTERLGFSCYVCQFIVRASLIKRNSIFFKDGILFEDTEWTPRMLRWATRVSSLRIIVYNYLFRSGSITHAKTEEQRLGVIESKIGLIGDLIQQSSSASDKRWYNGMVSFTVLSLFSILSSLSISTRRRYIQLLKHLDIFPLSFFHSTCRNAGKLMLINLSPELFCYAYHIKNKT